MKMVPSGKILLGLLHSSEVYMRVKKSKTAFILFASFFIFSACDFNNLKERIVITEENNELPETEVETETELPLENESKPKKLLLLVGLLNFSNLVGENSFHFFAPFFNTRSLNL